MKAILQSEFGGPEVLKYVEVPDPVQGDGQVRIAVEVAGVHLVDTSIRQGTSFGALPPPALPMIPGREVAGVVDALGPGVDDSWRGRRVVAHLGPASAGYAELAVADIDATTFPIPDDVDAAEAVAMVGTGRTALGILEVAAPRAGDVAVVTAAAGGIGSLLVPALRTAGGSVVAVAGGADKVALVERLGADVVIDYRATPEWPAAAREALAGRAVTLGLDGVGGAAGRAAFELVAPAGRFVTYGWASGDPMPLSVGDLYSTGITVAAGIGVRVTSRPGGVHALSADALEELAAGRLRPVVNPPFALANAAEAHRALEGRETVGKVVLVP